MSPPLLPQDITMTSETETALDLLGELVAIVRGECPSLLNEDSGGTAELSLRIDAALSRAPEAQKGLIDSAYEAGVREGWKRSFNAERKAAALSPPSTGGEGEAVAWRCLNVHGDAFLTEHANGAYFWAKSGKPVQPLYLHPSPEMGEISREEIAKIVDPTAFKQWQSLHDHCVAAGDDADEARETADWAHKATCDVALEKADQILKLKENGLSREVLGGDQPAPAVRGQGPNPVLTDGPLSDGWLDIASYDGCQPVLVGREPDKYLWGPFAAFKDATGVWRIHGGDGCMPLHFEPTLFTPLPAPPQNSDGGRG